MTGEGTRRLTLLLALLAALAGLAAVLLLR